VSGAGLQNGVQGSQCFTGEFSGSIAALSIGAPTNISPDGTLMKSNPSVAPLGDRIDIVLIDKNDAFVFGFSKLDVMFGRQMAAAARHPYRDIVKPSVRFCKPRCDPSTRPRSAWRPIRNIRGRRTRRGARRRPRPSGHARTAGGSDEFYSVAGAFASVAGAFALRDVPARFERGPAIPFALRTLFHSGKYRRLQPRDLSQPVIYRETTRRPNGIARRVGCGDQGRAMLPFSCPFGATNAGNTRQEAAHSETAKALDLSGKEARSDDARQTAAKRG
jgi:hypothetical protein